MWQEKGYDLTPIAWWRNYSGNYYSQRSSYYAVSGVPTAVFDGLGKVVGGGSDTNNVSGVLNRYRQEYDKRKAISSPLWITIIPEWITKNVKGQARISVTVRETVTTTNNKIWVVILEKNAGGTYKLFHCGRERILYEDFTLTQVGQSQNYKVEFDVQSGWNPDNLAIAVFVQSDANKEVIQSGWYDQFSQANIKQATWGGIKRLYK
ncbi:MAG: hypothetical protein JXA60_01010 [Candidatus Coatesbacteria bacterium]|nr:hypothetical protein [Candidatus Coatesbacteria bacterium]